MYFLKYYVTPALICYFLSLRVRSLVISSVTLLSSAFGLVYKTCLIFLMRSELILRVFGC